MERSANGRVTKIALAEYANVEGREPHTFLVGDLKRPTSHPFIRDHRLEIIMCRYAAGDDGQYHWHPSVTEYEMVTDGEVGYFEVASGETQWFTAGDLSVIPPAVCARRLVRRAATTIAVKIPSSAEKIHCSGCQRDCGSRLEPYSGASSG